MSRQRSILEKNRFPDNGLRIVTLSEDQFRNIIVESVAAGYAQAAEEYERRMISLAERIESSITASGHRSWFTVRQAALYASRSEDTILRWVRLGLPASKGVRGLVIQRADLDKWQEEGSGSKAGS